MKGINKTFAKRATAIRDGKEITFHSIRERDHYLTLAFLEKRGKIIGLKLQEKFIITPAIYALPGSGGDGEATFAITPTFIVVKVAGLVCIKRSTWYLADFTFRWVADKSKLIIQDVKPAFRNEAARAGWLKTQAGRQWKVKKNAVEKLYKIKIEEV